VTPPFSIACSSAALALFFLAAIDPAHAQNATAAEDTGAPLLHLPLACPDGMECPIQNYFDRDEGKGVLDHACGGMSYDGHTGTDFRLPTRAVMEQGVAVTASAAGVVAGTRDGVANHDGSDAAVSAAIAEGKECGNGVVLDHGGGWITQYCHLSPGLSVKRGDRVDVGATLGHVGITGAAAFPHVHLAVRYAAPDAAKGGEEQKLDPFRPDPAAACGASPTASLWAPEVAARLGYVSPQLLNAGFAAGPVTMQAIEDGTAGASPGADAPALVFFARSIGLKGGDVQTLRLVGPDGAVIAEQTADPLDRDKAQWMLFTGRKRRGDAWPAGEYRGEITVERGGETVMRAGRSLTIRP